MRKKKRQSPITHAVKLNSKRCARYYAEFKAAGAMWMLECRDLWDSEDEDAGVYFVDCSSTRAVNNFIMKMNRFSDRLLGIYDLTKPLIEQGPGLTLEEWKAR